MQYEIETDRIAERRMRQSSISGAVDGLDPVELQPYFASEQDDAVEEQGGQA